MGDIFSVTTFLVILVMSLCQNFFPSQPDYIFKNGEQRNVLLVIAHPDDESMFFTPTLNYFNSRGHNLHVLCVSTGNADGMGNIRKGELHQACATLKVAPEQVKILDHPHLQDGLSKVWNSTLLAKIIEEEIISQRIDTIISFDNYGISGHCNHQALHQGIRKLLLETSQENIEAWELVSTILLSKYSGPAGFCLCVLHAVFSPSKRFACLVNKRPYQSYLAMSQHTSQWVWYRKLFVLFSSYTYVNPLQRIDKQVLF